MRPHFQQCSRFQPATAPHPPHGGPLPWILPYLKSRKPLHAVKKNLDTHGRLILYLSSSKASSYHLIEASNPATAGIATEGRMTPGAALGKARQSVLADCYSSCCA